MKKLLALALATAAVILATSCGKAREPIGYLTVPIYEDQLGARQQPAASEEAK